MSTPANKITGANAGGPRQLSIRTPWAARIAQFYRFSRSKSEFIEIRVNDPARISYMFEVADPKAWWFRKFFKGVFHHEEALHSRVELVQKVEEFFTTPVQEMKRRLKSR